MLYASLVLPLASSLASLAAAAAAAASLETYRQRASEQGGGQAERRLADGRQAGRRASSRATVQHAGAEGGIVGHPVLSR